MSDFQREDREARMEFVLRQSVAPITRAIVAAIAMPNVREIDVLLAVGAACPYSDRLDRAVWVQAFHRVEDRVRGLVEVAA